MKSRFATGILAVLFLSVMFGGLFNMSAGMDMTGNSSGCPFMGHQEVMCSMNIFDHFSAWESTFMAIVPTFAVLITALVLSILALVVAPNLILSRRLLYNFIYKQKWVVPVFTHSVRPLQELFSQGILHPKLF